MQFVAFERAKQGTGASRRLRITGRTPGIVFGGDAEPTNIELDHNALWHALKKEAFHASILDMELDGKVHKVLLRDVQYHPFKQLVLHIDFQRVDAKTRVHKKIPLHFINADESPAVKIDNCVISHAMTEIEVECLAMQLPEHIEVDLANIVKGQTIHARELTMPKNVKRVTHGRTNLTVVNAVPPKVEIVAAPVEVAPVDDKKGKKGGKK
ncbi:50S ribosomal protein L25/general stress protein Ctc [Hydrogenophaga crassostreae]|uniref:Large ribosomal subunit protein bL25 n=1 Tax=Hydrogenophaga crassostreae TaxID=1763535 RepID=A0A162Z1K4_9BURK|nr:50S ribosomal protein L25/general stress protein Ctc [Hydrogenophaga crassostreae]AOW14552.1 50S ribosomal protein L25/general stress protein Ctc [Hydrogenophaga crassostreae]OAD43038.1 50S ribosomal protein L25/general stress protein Ctc [Hydrogenophaga crassostreae]